MFRSPPQLRSGAKGKAIALSGTDKPNLCRSLSDSTSPSSSKMPADNTKTTVDTATIEQIVNKHLSTGVVFEALVARLTEELRKVISDAINTATAPLIQEVKSLRGEVESLTTRVSRLEQDLENKTDDLEQYQRRNNLRVFGVEEREGESTDDLVRQLCHDQLGVTLSETALCRTHRVGKQPRPAADGKRRHRAIIVRFVSYQDRRLVFNAKKKLKGSGISIREDLTARRYDLLLKATEKYGLRNTWTQDGRVLYVDGMGHRGVATRLSDFSKDKQ